MDNDDELAQMRRSRTWRELSRKSSCVAVFAALAALASAAYGKPGQMALLAAAALGFFAISIFSAHREMQYVIGRRRA